MGRRAAKKAGKQQAKQIAASEALAEQKEKELQEERERIFRMTKPEQESASFQFGLQDRGEMDAYSDFVTGTDQPLPELDSTPPVATASYTPPPEQEGDTTSNVRNWFSGLFPRRAGVGGRNFFNRGF